MKHAIVLQAFNLAKGHSINSKNLNWKSIEEDILQQANQLNSEKDLYNILQTLINRLEDQHSYLITAEGKRWQKVAKISRGVTKNRVHLDELRNAKIAYIEVNPMSSSMELEMNTYAENLYNTIILSYKIDMTVWNVLSF